MPFNTDADYKNLITELIKKQIVVLGPFITLAKARNVKGLTVDDSGTVTAVSAPPQEVIQGLIDQFVQLSGLIVKKTMEPLLANYPDGINLNPTPQQTPPIPQVSPAIQQPPQAAPAQPTQTTQTQPENNQSSGAT